MYCDILHAICLFVCFASAYIRYLIIFVLEKLATRPTGRSDASASPPNLSLASTSSDLDLWALYSWILPPPPQLIVLCLCPGCPLDGPLVFRLLTSESVHLFLEYRVHNFNKRRTNGRMDALMDGWTNGQSDKRTYWEHYVTGRGIKTYKFKTTFTQVKQHKSISQWFFSKNKCILFWYLIKRSDKLVKDDIVDDVEWHFEVISGTVNGFIVCI